MFKSTKTKFRYFLGKSYKVLRVFLKFSLIVILSCGFSKIQPCYYFVINLMLKFIARLSTYPKLQFGSNLHITKYSDTTCDRHVLLELLILKLHRHIEHAKSLVFMNLEDCSILDNKNIEWTCMCYLVSVITHCQQTTHTEGEKKNQQMIAHKLLTKVGIQIYIQKKITFKKITN